MNRLIIALLLFLAGCRVAVIQPMTPTHEDATPTQELSLEELWGPGNTINPHSDSDYALIAVNENNELDAGIAVREKACTEIPDQSIQRCTWVETPLPYGLYRWFFEMVAIDGECEFYGAAPYVRQVENGFSVDISGMSGFAGLDLVHQQVYGGAGGLGRYVVGMEFLSHELTPYEPGISLTESIDKICFVMVDNGSTIRLSPQPWSGETPESAVYVLQFESPHSFLLRCGVNLRYAGISGDVVFDRFFVAPVGPEYGSEGYVTTVP